SSTTSCRTGLATVGLVGTGRASVMHEDDAAALASELERGLAQGSERCADRVVPLRRREEHQEAAAAGAQQLAALGAGVSRRLVGLVDLAVADAGGEALLQPPGRVEHGAERIDVAVADRLERLPGEA